MYTRQDLMEDLRRMGIKPTDTVLVHASMKAVGETEGGADTVLDAFMEYLKEGLFLMPTHTWANITKPYQVFDPKTEPSCVGVLTNLFFKRPGVVRSLHPTHSVAAFGKRAAEYVAGEENLDTPCPPQGVYGRLRSERAKILLLGVNHIKNTFIHSVEESYDVPNRVAEETTPFYVKMPDGSQKEILMHRHYCSLTDHVSENYQKMAEAFYETGAAKDVKFGDASCILCDADRIFQITARVLRREKNSLVELPEIPREWWERPDVEENYAQVEERVKKACGRAGRSRDEVSLIAVSKTKPVEMIEDLEDAGVCLFGENRVQELCGKIEFLGTKNREGKPVSWHLIGQLQRNKVKYIVDKAALIHSVDSLSLAKEILKEARKKQVKCRILIEVNMGGEESKGGVRPEDAAALVKAISQEITGDELSVEGLMTVAPYTSDPETNRVYFRRMRLLRDEIGSLGLPGVRMKELSMGMTGDFEVAIQEGATMVRVGTAIFGERNYGRNR